MKKKKMKMNIFFFFSNEFFRKQIIPLERARKTGKESCFAFYVSMYGSGDNEV